MFSQLKLRMLDNSILGNMHQITKRRLQIIDAETEYFGENLV